MLPVPSPPGMRVTTRSSRATGTARIASRWVGARMVRSSQGRRTESYLCGRRPRRRDPSVSPLWRSTRAGERTGRCTGLAHPKGPMRLGGPRGWCEFQSSPCRLISEQSRERVGREGEDGFPLPRRAASPRTRSGSSTQGSPEPGSERGSGRRTGLEASALGSGLERWTVNRGGRRSGHRTRRSRRECRSIPRHRSFDPSRSASMLRAKSDAFLR